MAANVDSMRSEKRHEKFVPLVAFECGFRNKFMAEDGTWVNDVNRYATCQSGKLDILKYCRKVISFFFDDDMWRNIENAALDSYVNDFFEFLSFI